MRQVRPDNSSDLELVKMLERIEQHLAAIRTSYQRANDEWLTVPEVAQTLKVSKETVLRLIASRQLKAAEIETDMGAGKRHLHRIHRDWVRQFMFGTVEDARPEVEPPLRSPPRRTKGKIDFIG